MRNTAFDQTDAGYQDLDVEREETPEEREDIEEPFNPEDIDVVTRSMTVDLLLSRAASKMIDLQPDFQRRWGIWDIRRQSRLIESLLLRIPLPVLYAAENDDERWEIVDGIQRLSTIARFVKPDIIGEEPLILSGLEYLRDFEGKNFEGLGPRLQMRLRETELVTHLIRKGTPPEVKFNIFARINTGGIELSPQELRHATTPGKARDILETWSNLPEFLQATDRSVRPNRMDDRELILRFIAFYKLGLDAYRQPDMDGFLIAAMNKINSTDDAILAEDRKRFERAMTAAYAIFGKHAFRKRLSADAGRSRINKAVFEALSVNLARFSDTRLETLVSRSEEVSTGFIQLCKDNRFEAAVSQGTGGTRKVRHRFEAVRTMLETVTNHA